MFRALELSSQADDVFEIILFKFAQHEAFRLKRRHFQLAMSQAQQEKCGECGFARI